MVFKDNFLFQDVRISVLSKFTTYMGVPGFQKCKSIQ